VIQRSYDVYINDGEGNIRFLGRCRRGEEPSVELLAEMRRIEDVEQLASLVGYTPTRPVIKRGGRRWWQRLIDAFRTIPARRIRQQGCPECAKKDALIRALMRGH
jgi:hypothetical protein